MKSYHAEFTNFVLRIIAELTNLVLRCRIPAAFKPSKLHCSQSSVLRAMLCVDHIKPDVWRRSDSLFTPAMLRSL